jgi:5-formyltetrahydrofolate cyclo-ligase
VDLEAAKGDPREAKRALREAMRARRAEVSAADAASGGARAAALLAAHLGSHNISISLLYSPLPGELDTAPIDRMLRARGGAVAYPRVGEGLALHAHLARPEELTAGRFAIREPSAAAPEVAAADLDLMIVPGLAFDRAGHRLGFGRGYYDALLQSAPRALRVGAGYDWQLCPRVPAEPHDQPLDLLLVGELVATGARPLKEMLP